MAVSSREGHAPLPKFNDMVGRNLEVSEYRTHYRTEGMVFFRH